MPRPKSDDPKEAVTLRLKRSALARWKTGGEDWRAKMEAALSGGPTSEPAPKVVKPKAVPKVERASIDLGEGRAVMDGEERSAKIGVSVPLGSFTNRGPRPKTGKSKP